MEDRRLYLKIRKARVLLFCPSGGLLRQVKARNNAALSADQRAFVTAAELSLEGVSAWARRYGDFLNREARRESNAGRTAELRARARIAGKVATAPPETFHEALQLIWFVHQAIHVEGHGTPDRLDPVLPPFYEADMKAGGIAPEPGELKSFDQLSAAVGAFLRDGIKQSYHQEMQINVVDSATLRAAQKNPEQFRDLVVRIAGFSEFFVNLTPAMQEEIIVRTEHR